jgi:hypothetical protein
MLPAGPAHLWSGGGRVVVPGDEAQGEFEVSIPFTPLRAGRVETRVAVFWQACTEQFCEQPEVAYLPMAFDVAPATAAAAATGRRPRRRRPRSPSRPRRSPAGPGRSS